MKATVWRVKLAPASAFTRAVFLSFTSLIGFLGVQLLARTPHSAETPPPLEIIVRPVQKAPEPTKPEFPPGFNHALASNGALAIGGRDPALLIDGDFTNYTGGTGFAMTQWNAEPLQSFLITLKKPVNIDCIRLLLWDREETRYYRYKIETCPNDNAKEWDLAADQTGPTAECRSWQTIRFTPRLVHQIRMTGTFNSANNGFHVVELQASLGIPVEAAEEKPSPENLDF